MIIEVEGYHIHALLCGKAYTLRELREKARQAESLADQSYFIPLFCRLNGYEPIEAHQGVLPDFVIDLDTFLVYCPRYDAD